MAERDYLITVGKHPVWASSVPKSTAHADSASVADWQDYPVTVGKRTVMASQIAPQQRVVAVAANPCLGSEYVTTGKATRFAPACSLQGDSAAPSCCR